MAHCANCGSESAVVDKTFPAITYDCPNDDCEEGIETQPRAWLSAAASLAVGFGTAGIYTPEIGAVAFALVFTAMVWISPFVLTQISLAEVGEA